MRAAASPTKTTTPTTIPTMAPVPRSEPFVGEVFETGRGEAVLGDCNTDGGLSEVVEGVDKALDVTGDAEMVV